MRVDYICETCGKSGHRCYAQGKVPSHFFCSRECQNEWQKTREDIVLKNKDPEFRKKVSAGLKRRKQELGENYHSPETKRKIGDATLEHWENYDDETRAHMLQVLQDNATARRTYGDYDYEWSQLSAQMRENGICHRCGSREKLDVHHIIPTKQGGTRAPRNLVVLCSSCHTLVENQQRKIYEIIPDWNVVQILVRERLHCL
ncbi:MAG: HNH endonuclease [Oscillospiraceae bacterium]|nr:HNH endonuclease [Oscillospiraceae bacterium]